MIRFLSQPQTAAHLYSSNSCPDILNQEVHVNNLGQQREPDAIQSLLFDSMVKHMTSEPHD